MIKAILFDLDGTLVNSLEDLANSANFALTKFGFPTHETEKYKYFVGDGMPKLIERVLPEGNRDEATHKAVLDCFMAHYREHYVDKTAVYDGVGELLKNLGEMGLNCAVISNKAQEMAVTVVEKLLPKKFCFVLGKQAGFPAKPHPALTLKLIDDLGVTPQECLLIGDSGMDMAAAVNAGCIGVGVLWGFRTEAELRENGARYIAKAPNEIINIVKDFNND